MPEQHLTGANHPPNILQFFLSISLVSGYSAFFTRNIFYRASEAFHRVVIGPPGTWIDVLETESPDAHVNNIPTGRVIRALNTGSYNYLGISERNSPVNPWVKAAILKHSVSTACPRSQFGCSLVQRQLEELFAKFLGKEDCFVYGMGFATNSQTLPAILSGPETLVLSDSLNHASLAAGMRESGAVISVFEHNDLEALEEKIRRGIIYGHPRTRRPFRKILIVVEGIYSMEGDICNLPAIVQIKNKYNVNIYVDEAHSIGALGPTGRGIIDYWNIDPREVEILMGTLTKSFGSTGGYICGSRKLIQYLRACSVGATDAISMSPVAAAQALRSLQMIMGIDGTTSGQDRIQQLRKNTHVFREELKKRGFKVVGHPHSPVVPVMVYYPGRLVQFSRECLKRGLAMVIVGPPATPATECRIRFCLSAGHTDEDIQFVLDIVEQVGRDLNVIW